MIGYKEIAAVIRELDSDAEHFGIEAILTKLSIDVSVLKIAQQRALRVWMMEHGIPLPKGSTPTPISGVNEVDLLNHSATWLDGFTTGVRLVHENFESSHRRSG